MFRYLLTIIILFTITAGFAQHANNSLVNSEKRQEWINTTASQLPKKFIKNQYKNIIIKKTDYNNETKLSVRVLKEGIIELSKNSWIYIVTNSSHEDPEIGDVSLAIDNKKNIYLNEGHVCGGIIHFETKQLSECKKSVDFFKYFQSDTEGSKWKKYKPKK